MVAIDINPAMLAVGSVLPPEPSAATIIWKQADAARLPWPDASFDVALCQQGRQFFPDPAAARRETRRVLAPGARAGFSVWRGLAKNPTIAVISEMATRQLRDGPFDTTFRLGDAAALEALLVDAGSSAVTVAWRQLSLLVPSRTDFVRRLIGSVTPVVPARAKLDAAPWAALGATITAESEAPLRDYAWGDGIEVTLNVKIAPGRVEAAPA